MVSDAVGNHPQTRQSRQAVVDAFRDSVGDVVGVGIVAPILERQNGDGVYAACLGSLQIYAKAYSADYKQTRGDH